MLGMMMEEVLASSEGDEAQSAVADLSLYRNLQLWYQCRLHKINNNIF